MLVMSNWQPHRARQDARAFAAWRPLLEIELVGPLAAVALVALVALAGPPAFPWFFASKFWLQNCPELWQPLSFCTCKLVFNTKGHVTSADELQQRMWRTDMTRIMDIDTCSSISSEIQQPSQSPMSDAYLDWDSQMRNGWAI